MVAHLVDGLRMATGELETQDLKRPIRVTPLKQFLIYGPPFPRNVPTAPELLSRELEDWDAECSNLRRMMEAFASRPQGAELPRHPAFGRLSRRAWGVLSYRHIDHHFRQFGV
jgi:hypothetical protein